MNWAEIWSEGRNKTRWAMRSTAYAAGVFLGSQEVTDMADKVADELLATLKERHESHYGGTAKPGGDGPKRRASK